ncbi:hypothetical protein DY000_02024817 [Brassica cretica]|uniref:Uncharacterized protein n=1 Tax=Brassica cretica TaxID=69181 RepID=A0ABQ7E8F9_BRACR|nr:hypothetical protein DY000_02024817 [Brassica cretica]
MQSRTRKRSRAGAALGSRTSELGSGTPWAEADRGRELEQMQEQETRSGGYIAEHPNDEEEVEGIDLHQQRYPWEGSDMDYLYDESSFAQLLSMELTLEIDGAIFHVPNANASSNVDSQLEHAKITMQWVFEITKLAMCQDSKSISADG